MFLHDCRKGEQFMNTNNKLVHLSYSIGNFFRPRVGPTYSLVELAPPSCPIPDKLSEETFDTAMDSVMARFATEAASNDREIYVLWSGGIDSTAIVVGMLKNFDSQLLSRVTVLCNQASIVENPYFYYKFLHNKFKILDADEFQLTNENVRSLYLFDGEGGNQCSGSSLISECKYHNLYDLLQSPLKNLHDLVSVLARATVKNASEFFEVGHNVNHSDPRIMHTLVDYILESAPLAPVDISTVYDGLWWFNFNTKFEEVLFRKIPAYVHKLTNENSKFAFEDSVVRVYAQKEFQVWALVSLKERYSKLLVDTKYHAKKYIFDFDQNQYYFENKMEVSSILLATARTHLYGSPLAIFGISEQWHKYHLGNPDDRKVLGEILKGN